jgi:hypothetical protein
MRSKVATILRSAVLFLAATLASCGGSTTSGPTTTVTALTITGAAALTGVGQTSQLSVTATTSAGAAQTVTSQAAWQSSNTAVATVSPAGLVTAQAFGAATISASYQGAASSLPVVVTLAGTWVAAGPEGSSLTWVLTQSQGLVSGTFNVGPITPGNSLSAATVNGTVSGSTFTWTMTGTVGSDSGHPECVGTTPIITGVAQVATSGGSMNATVQGVAGICDAHLVPIVPVGAAITFVKS